MNFYRVSITDGLYHWTDTLATAHKLARDWPKDMRVNVLIEQVDVPTDKAGILALIHNQQPDPKLKAVKSWGLTPRGGLKECAPSQ